MLDLLPEEYERYLPIRKLKEEQEANKLNSYNSQSESRYGRETLGIRVIDIPDKDIKRVIALIEGYNGPLYF